MYMHANLHARMHAPFQVVPQALRLHCHSCREGREAWTEGVIDAVARRYYGMQGLSIKLTKGRQDKTCEHEVRVCWRVVGVC